MRVEKNDERFTIRDEEEGSGSLYIADAENLRIEKLNTRVTLVAIFIPCLLVIILAVAYLDIKKRVASTQNTGSMGVQNLSKDLESRFSSLSLKQAKLEAQFTEHTKKWETASAALQVNLKKTSKKFGQITGEKADRSELAAISEKTEASISKVDKGMADLHNQMKELNEAFTKFDEDLASQILLMAKGFKKSQGRLETVEKRARKLETEKLSKEAMNLSLGLERLALQEMVKDRIREVNNQLTSLNNKVDMLTRKLNEQSKNVSKAPPSAFLPEPSHSTENQARSPEIEEQTIQ